MSSSVTNSMSFVSFDQAGHIDDFFIIIIDNLVLKELDSLQFFIYIFCL